MAIRIIQGVPGSGKTYYAVKHLADNYFERQTDGRYELVKPCTIITNIDSFKPAHVSLQDAIKDAGGVKKYFTESHQKKCSERYEDQIIYIIDEAQKLFRKNDRDLNDVFTYFEIHRHFGHDIYLITQNSKKLPPDLVLLTEYIIDAAPRSRSVIGEFKYKWLSDGEILKREGFRPDKGIFELYKSMDVKETEKISNPVMRTFWIVISVCFIVICLGIYSFKSTWGGTEDTKTSLDDNMTIPESNKNSEFLELSGVGNIIVRVDRGTVYRRIGKKGEVIPITYIFLGNLCFRQEKFPYKIERMLGEYYATVPHAVAVQAGLVSLESGAPGRGLRSDLSGAIPGQIARIPQR